MQVNKENENEIPDEKWSKKDGSQHCQTAGSPNKMKVEIPLWTPVLGEFLDPFVTASRVEWSRQKPDWISGRWQLELMSMYQQLSRQALPWVARRKITAGVGGEWGSGRDRHFYTLMGSSLCLKKKKIQMQGIEKRIIKGSWEEEVEWIQSRVDVNWKDVYFIEENCYWRKWVKKWLQMQMYF